MRLLETQIVAIVALATELIDENGASVTQINNSMLLRALPTIPHNIIDYK